MLSSVRVPLYGCETEQQVWEKIKAAVVTLIFWCLPNVPAATRWLTCTGCVGWFMLGCLLNRVMIRGYRACWGKAREKLKIPDLEDIGAISVSGENDIENAADEWLVRVGKRLRRGARFFSDRLCSAKMAFSLLILLPLHHLLSGFFGGSKHEFTNVNEMIGKANRCVDRITRILHADVMTSEKWTLMRCADLMVLEDQDFRKYMRRELHRELGGMKCRVVEFYLSGALPLVRTLEVLDVSSQASVDADVDFALTLARCRGAGRECCEPNECKPFEQVHGYRKNSASANCAYTQACSAFVAWYHFGHGESPLGKSAASSPRVPQSAKHTAPILHLHIFSCEISVCKDIISTQINAEHAFKHVLETVCPNDNQANQTIWHWR